VNRPAYALGATAIFCWGAAYLKEWVTYHRMVGVEHFWLYTDSDRDTWQPILASEVERGIVEVIAWPTPAAGYSITHAVDAYKDALERARHECEWLAVLDIDEFILPAEDDTVVRCLERHFSNASGVYVNWRNFGTSGVWLDEGDPILSRLTACAVRDHPSNAVGKSIVRPDRVRIAEAWYPHHFVLEPGGIYCDGDGQVLASNGVEPILDGKCHDRYLRINHYGLRDENYFRTTRLRSPEGIGREPELEWEHYHAYSTRRDVAIMDFIRHRHPADYAAFWA
jgi:Glycosyltransferase family 92